MAATKKPSAANYRALGAQIARQVGVPWNIFDALVNQESGWNPNARSPVGAMGFTQLMPGTAQGLGVDPNDPVQNLRGGAMYLKHQLQAFGGDVAKALAAYNAGPGAVQKYGGIPPYAETQNYVKNIMAAATRGGSVPVGAAWGGGAGDTGKPLPPGSPAPDGLAGMMPSIPGMAQFPRVGNLASILNFAKPTSAAVGALQNLGGLAARIKQQSQAPISLPEPPQAANSSVSMPGANAGGGGMPVEFPPMIPMGGGLRGQVPMKQGVGNIQQRYPNLQVQSQADWVHVNPRLLQLIQKVAEKHGFVAVINSGYRSAQYNKGIGGAQSSRHMSGLAVDAYVNGHPIGEVIPPEEWAKLGIRSGNVPGFFNGKPDPMHLDMAGIPLKQKGPKA